jgi:outer membrane biosynthesis protein TonB
MATSSRQLHFAVGTSLLTATLLVPSLGCKTNHTVNERPPEEPHVNEGPTPDVVEPDPDSADAGSVEPDSPEPEPEPDNVNVGPQPEPEPKHVNTRPGPGL